MAALPLLCVKFFLPEACERANHSRSVWLNTSDVQGSSFHPIEAQSPRISVPETLYYVLAHELTLVLQHADAVRGQLSGVCPHPSTMWSLFML